MSSQLNNILLHLQNGNSITTLDALNLFGCFRLGARIFDLKQLGYNIVNTMITLENGKRIASYSLLVDEAK